MSTIDRLKSFLRAEDTGKRMNLARDLFSTTVVRDDLMRPSEADEFFDDLQKLPQLVDVAFLDAVEALGKVALVFEGKDPETERWHRCSWLIQLKDGKVDRFVVTDQVKPESPGQTAA